MSQSVRPLTVIDAGGDVPYVDIVRYTDVPFSMRLWEPRTRQYVRVVLESTTARPWQIERRARRIVVPRTADLGVRLPTRRDRTRQAFLRGTEALYGVDVVTSAVMRAAADRVGPFSLARSEAMRAECRADRRNRIVADQVASHRARFGHLYESPASPISRPVQRSLSDVVVSAGNARPKLTERAHRYDHDDRLSWELERAADDLLKSAGDLDSWGIGHDETLTRLDIVDRYTRKPQVAPDAIARGGIPRYVETSHRYHARPIVEGAYMVDSLGICTRPLAEFRTDATGRGYGWIGHRRIVVESRGKTASTRGRKFHAMTANDGSVRRRWAKATDEQRAIAQALRTRLVADGSAIVQGARVSIVPTPTERVIVQTSEQGDRVAEGSFTLDQYVRRVALS